MFEITGAIEHIGDTETFGTSGFRKRILVLQFKQGRFDQYVPIEFVQDNCDTLDELAEGDVVTVKIEIGGRKWQRDAASDVKYFPSLTGKSWQRTEAQ